MNRFSRLITTSMMTILLLTAVSLSSAPLSAKKLSYRLTSSKNAKKENSADAGSYGNSALTLTADSLRFPDLKKLITLSGYDKRMNSNFETFLIYNASNGTITSFIIDLEYESVDNQSIHQRHESVTQTIPPGTRRKIDIRSWDRQHSYYYYRSTPPRNPAIPYKVTITLTSITFLPGNTDEEF